MIRRLLIALVLVAIGAQAHASSNGILTQGLSSATSSPGGSTSLSALTSATALNSFDNAAFPQTWTWNSLSTQTAFMLSSSSLTNGTVLSIQNSSAAATSTGQVFSLSDATTGAGYGIYSNMTGTNNTGYSGYFTNSSTSGYAIYANGPVGYGSAVSIKVRTVTASGAVTVQPGSDYFICINKGTPAATTVNLPANPATGNIYLIKDCALNDATFNITLTPASGNIEGASTYVMHTSTATFGDIVGVVYTGSQWNLE